VELSKGDLDEIENAAANITIQGHRYAQSSQIMVDE